MTQLHPEERQRYLGQIDGAVRARKDWDLEYRCVLPDGTARDIQGRILDVNRQACESLGYTREELIGKTAMMFDNWLTPVQLMQIAERVIAGEVFAFETRHTRKDGADFPVEIHIRPFFHGGQHLGAIPGPGHHGTG